MLTPVGLCKTVYDNTNKTVIDVTVWARSEHILNGGGGDNIETSMISYCIDIWKFVIYDNMVTVSGRRYHRAGISRPGYHSGLCDIFATSSVISPVDIHIKGWPRSCDRLSRDHLLLSV